MTIIKNLHEESEADKIMKLFDEDPPELIIYSKDLIEEEHEPKDLCADCF